MFHLVTSATGIYFLSQVVEEDYLQPSKLWVKKYENFIGAPDLKFWKQTNIVIEKLNTLSYEPETGLCLSLTETITSESAWFIMTVDLKAN